MQLLDILQIADIYHCLQFDAKSKYSLMNASGEFAKVVAAHEMGNRAADLWISQSIAIAKDVNSAKNIERYLFYMMQLDGLAFMGAVATSLRYCNFVVFREMLSNVAMSPVILRKIIVTTNNIAAAQFLCDMTDRGIGNLHNGTAILLVRDAAHYGRKEMIKCVDPNLMTARDSMMCAVVNADYAAIRILHEMGVPMYTSPLHSGSKRSRIKFARNGGRKTQCKNEINKLNK